MSSPSKTRRIDKKQIGNEKRLQAEHAKRLAQKSNVAAVQQALKNIDTAGCGPNKRIVFADDDNDDDEERRPADQSTPICKETNPLFSDDSDDEGKGEKPDEPSFHLREQFEGEKGQKLFDLQSKFNNDMRFRIDHRFLEMDKKKDDDEELNAENEVDESDNEKTNTKSQEDTNPEEKNKESELKDKYYFAVTQNLSHLFSSTTEKPKFSLFSSQEASEENRSFIEDKKEPANSDNKVSKKPRLQCEPETEAKSQSVNPFKPSGWFFIRPGDECLKEGVQFFCRHDTEEDLRAKWAAFRPTILEGFKKLKRGHGKPKNKWKKDNN